jgi:hypothetical protein
MDTLFLILAYVAGGIALCYIVLGIWYFRHKRKFDKTIKKFQSEIRHAVLESLEETERLRSTEIPSDEDILLYYKMYCKKFELDTRDTWTTLKPITLDEWESKVKDTSKSVFGWRYMIPKTSDAMVGFPPNCTFHRYRDYKAMVEADDNAFFDHINHESEEETNA